MPSHPLTIADVSDLTGLTAHTLRYYERIGLMVPVERAGSGHRLYDKHAVQWVDLLRNLRETGMPIAEMHQFADLVRQGDHTVPQRVALLEAYRAKVCDTIAAHERCLAALDHKLACYRGGEAVTPSVPQGHDHDTHDS